MHCSNNNVIFVVTRKKKTFNAKNHDSLAALFSPLSDALVPPISSLTATRRMQATYVTDSTLIEILVA